MNKYYCLIILVLIFNNNYALSKDILEETLIYRGNLAFDQETDEPISGTAEHGKQHRKGRYGTRLERGNDFTKIIADGSNYGSIASTYRLRD